MPSFSMVLILQPKNDTIMKEEFIYYLWENRLLSKDLTTIDGEEVGIINVGVRNHDAGPDYLDARIRIGSTLWVGHVEMHVNTSDWFKHGHQDDAAYPHSRSPASLTRAFGHDTKAL